MIQVRRTFEKSLKSVMIVGSVLFFQACGSTSDINTNGSTNVTIPEVTYVCKQSTAESCYNKETVAYFATDTCTVANINAGKYVAQAGTVSSTSECSGGYCTTKFTEWFPVGTTRTGTRITTMAPGTYRLCVYINTNGSKDSSNNPNLGDSGDYLGEVSGIVVKTSTAAQTVSTFSAI